MGSTFLSNSHLKKMEEMIPKKPFAAAWKLEMVIWLF